MLKFILILPCLLGLSQTLRAAEEPDCNQLGREIALRAAEQMPVSLDADSRRQLAVLAETACLEHMTGAAAPAPASAPPAAADAETPGTASGSGLFDLELVDPADRVRRGGLKRR